MGPHRIVLLLGALALAVGACSGVVSTGPAGSPGTLGSPPPSANPAGLIFRAADEGGFLAPNAVRARLPIVSVYADGRIMTEGATPAIYPGPLLPSIVFRSVGADGAAAILKAAADAGLTGSGGTYGPGPLPDAPTTVITVIHGDSQTVSRFFSLEPQPGQADSNGPAARVQAAAAALLGRLMGTDTFGGPPGAEGTYQPLGFQLFISPGSPGPTDQALARPPVSWPLATPLAAFGQADSLGGDGARVGVVVDAGAATLGPILAVASQITPFASGGKLWTIVVKPLLPDEAAAVGG
jgi:hypothetical protein